MIYENDCTLPKEYIEWIAREGLEGLPELIRLVVNEAMRMEREQHLHASPYERSQDSQDQGGRDHPGCTAGEGGRILSGGIGKGIEE